MRHCNWHVKARKRGIDREGGTSGTVRTVLVAFPLVLPLVAGLPDDLPQHCMSCSIAGDVT